MSDKAKTLSNTVDFVNPEQAMRCLGVLFTAGVPMNLVGGPGTAKTTVFRDFVTLLNGDIKDKKEQYELIVAVLSRMEPGDFGMPFKDNGDVKFMIPSFLPFNRKCNAILFLDEWDRASSEMQNVSLQLMLDRNFHGNHLADSVYVAMACNGTSDAYTTPLSEAARTRCCTIYTSAHAKGFEESWMNWASNNGIEPEVQAFRKYLGASISKHESFEEQSVCNDRTLEFASRIIGAIGSVGFETADIEQPLLSGVIGKAAAIELLNTRRLMAEAPTVEEILKNPAKCRLPENESIMFALSCRLTAVAKSSANDVKEKLAQYGLRFRKDITASLLTGMLRDYPRLSTQKDVKAWIDENKTILL